MGNTTPVLVFLVLACSFGISQAWYYGEEFPVCPFCNTTVCSYLDNTCNPLTSSNLATCENYVNNYCFSAGSSAFGCECCVFNSTSASCFEADSRCDGGVNNWFCASGTTTCDELVDSCDGNSYGESHLREIYALSDTALLNGWTVRHATDIVNGDFKQANLAPSFWQDDRFVYLQGSLNTGADDGIFVLPVGFRPAHTLTFVCSSAPDDTNNVTTPILVTVHPDGMVFAADNHTRATTTSLFLKGFFTYSTNLTTWTSLSSFVSAEATIVNNPEFFKDTTTGWVYIQGHIKMNCTSAECVVMSGLTVADVLPQTMTHSLYFVQDKDSAGYGRYLRFSADGNLMVSGSTGNMVDDIYLNGIILTEEAVSDYNSNDVSMKNLTISDDYWESSNSTRYQKSAADVVQLSGMIAPYNYSFHNAFVGTVESSYAPIYRHKQIVPCFISPKVFSCAVIVETTGSVYVFSPLVSTPYDYDIVPDTNAANWVALDGVRFGGYVYLIQLEIQGASLIELGGGSFIEIG